MSETACAQVRIRCPACGRILAELVEGGYVIKCSRCGRWCTPAGAFLSREQIPESSAKSVQQVAGK